MACCACYNDCQPAARTQLNFRYRSCAPTRRAVSGSGREGPKHGARARRTQHDKQHLCDLAGKVQDHLVAATQLRALSLRYSIILDPRGVEQEAFRALKRRGHRVQDAEAPAVAVTSGGMDPTPGADSQVNSLSAWDSMLEFPTDPELWLQLD